jgi:signal transduction histidine kinase
VVRIGITKDAEGRTIKTHGANQDITERKRDEEALRQANKKLKLLSGINRHDIRNQLMTLNGYIALLHKKIPDPSYNDYFSRITAASSQVRSLIEFTKEYELIGVQAPTWQEVRTLVDHAGKEGMSGQIALINDLPAGATMYADPLIAKVFFNLVDNAVRHGGKIKTLRFSSEERNGDRIIVCEDDGDGIVPDEKELIFDLGFGKNTGFGLAISREILDITGITIKETGEAGKGARFEITVPVGQYRSGS